ncbi:MAG: DHH family phosphoesterase [Planctomycetota bacterium]|nr:DHH family phosphoesterase [Planctomycetota bacterium]MEC8511291.1 DHH family phosphoesterase [Planctomycetota bacterium]
MIEFQPPPTTDAQRAAVEMLASARTLLLTGHERPDGDCVGSQAALARMLTACGADCFVLNPDPPEQRYRELISSARFLVDDGGPLPEHDVAVMLDGGDLSRTGALAERLRAAPSSKVVIDHHLHDGDAWWDAAFVDTSASATGVLVRRIGAHLGAPVDAQTAVALYTTLVTDTGWFKYSNTDAETMLIAAELVERGVEPAAVYGDLFQRQDRSHVRTISAALARTSYYADGKLAVVDLPLQPDGTPLEVDGDVVHDLLRAVESVEVALLLRAIEPARCKLSARSKGPFDAQRFAAGFGGGGHVKAAGATLECDITRARLALVDAALAQMAATGSSPDQPGV